MRLGLVHRTLVWLLGAALLHLLLDADEGLLDGVLPGPAVDLRVNVAVRVRARQVHAVQELDLRRLIRVLFVAEDFERDDAVLEGSLETKEKTMGQPAAIISDGGTKARLPLGGRVWCRAKSS